MLKREDIETQMGFLEKDTKQVQERLKAVENEAKQLRATLSSLNGAIQVSQHYLNMFDNNEVSNEESVDEKDDLGFDTQLEETKDDKEPEFIG
ncbi:MAG: hypothetical protein CMK23_08475 [Porticoccaceae bacterium]|jgi:DNA-binding protein YbaB|nr:hypothetical protein [Porticoccaceae bacterium]|tara:strand:+ start:5753 stop:6031 length:279 start_codon:yes stop_codon:yes gene_type:complete